LRLKECLYEWGNVLKVLDESQEDDPNVLLLECVRAVDRLAHAILSDRIQESTQHLNASVQATMSWARVAGFFDEAPWNAEKIFEALQFEYGENRDLWTKIIKSRRDLYFAILWAWNRSKLREAPEKVLHGLGRMKEEQASKPFRESLVSVECYNVVMNMLCKHLSRSDVVQQVRNLWQDMEAESIQPDQKTYDCLIHAYQREGRRPDEAYKVFLELLQAYLSEADLTKRLLLKPHPPSLNRILTMYQHDPDKGRLVLNEALKFEDRHTECRGFVTSRHTTTLMQYFIKKRRVEEAQ
jgi:hypothetical protein